MKVTVIQEDIVWKDVAANISRIERLLDEAERSDIYLLPEMCTTGFCMQPQGVAEEGNGSLSVEAIRKKAVELDAAIALPVMTHIDGKFYNRIYFITPEGVSGHYDKCNLFEYSGEDKVFEAGKARPVWEWRGIRIRPAICYDLRFPVFLYNSGEYDLLLIAANFPDSRLLAWDTLVSARAIENICYVAAANRTGADEYGTYKGHSVILSPYGQTIASCRDNEQGCATADLDDEMIVKARAMRVYNRRD